MEAAGIVSNLDLEPEVGFLMGSEDPGAPTRPLPCVHPHSRSGQLTGVSSPLGSGAMLQTDRNEPLLQLPGVVFTVAVSGKSPNRVSGS